MEIILKAENISRTYENGQIKVEALKKCDISVEKGSFVAIIGKSGSGKSTLLRILGSMDKPTTGTVLIEKQDINAFKDKKLAKFRRTRIGFVYQDYGLFSEYNAYENIIMPLVLDGAKIDKEHIEGLMDELEISHCKAKFPNQMSGGEQQRVAIARALATKPAIIYADEPTGNLDAASAKKVAELLAMASEKYNQTIIMVTHDKQVADYADVIFNIVDGNVSC